MYPGNYQISSLVIRLEKNLRVCPIDGFYRGFECPKCGQEGRNLMYPDEVDAIGRILAGILRHFPENYGIKLSKNGYAKIYSIVPAIKTQRRKFGWLAPIHIEALGKTDERGRYQVNEREEIRATYDHTIPVILDDLPVDDIPDILYYQTTEEEFSLIRETGISPSDKTYIHLSSTFRKTYVTGLFHVDDPLVIGINTDELRKKIPVYRASKEVYLTTEIPPEFILSIEQEKIELSQEEREEVENYKERRERRILGEKNNLKH